MRCEDQCYLDFLRRLREGICTNEDVDMLNQRVVGQEVDITSILDAPIIAPGNQLVTAVNNLFTGKHSQERLVYVCHAEDYTGRKDNRKVISKRLAKIIQKLPATSTRGLPREFQFYIGMSVMVTRNLFTELGITNGTTGVIKSVHFKDEVELIDDAHIGLIDLDQQPLYIVVELKDINMEALEGLPANHVPIYPQTESIQVRIPKKNTKASFTRRHQYGTFGRPATKSRPYLSTNRKYSSKSTEKENEG